jgi:hypothetical protein
MSPVSSFKKLSTEVKVGLAIISALFGIVTGVWAVDDRYVDQSEIVQTLEQYDASIQKRMDEYEKDNQIKDYNRLTDQYYQHKRLKGMYPDDVEIREEFDSIKSRRESLGQELGL